MKLKLGQRVKLLFTKTSGEVAKPRDAATGKKLPWGFGGEQMWVIITAPKDPETGQYTGRLLSKPLAVDYTYDQTIFFREDEVLEARGPTLKARVMYTFFNWAAPGWSIKSKGK